ncbi:MAG TPA: acyl-CoA reductase, partial [Chitinophagaceae bacterium]|nr:acyl-CoA reductase [Chitinophagaceae bacterium]
SQLNYEYYADLDSVLPLLNRNKELQCIVGHSHIPFGHAQSPGLFDYADNVDTLRFLNSL